MADQKLSRYNRSRKKSRHGSASSSNAEKRASPRRTAAAPTPDIVFENHFSLFLIRRVSPAGQSWLDENVGDSETMTFGGAIACEPRYVEAIYRGALADGLVCQ